MTQFDERTIEYYNELTARQAEESISGVYWPHIQAEMALEHGERPSRILYSGAYDGLYGEWYRCLAYMRFGYGFTSNNARRRAGLKPVRRLRF